MFKAVKTQLSYVKRALSNICIVGAGPAGFYAAQHLAKKVQETQIDIIEKLPVPFGLVRYGVAPDHPEVKNVINTFTKTAQLPNVNFYGNIELGKDVSLQELRQFYNIVLLTYGADKNRSLNIPGEHLTNVIPARQIVGWYNGLPENKNLKINLDVETAAIIGQGNVAVDVARILLTPIEELQKTDITHFSLERISQSKLKKVYLIGRRGPLQAAYTIKELREMLKLKDCVTVWRTKDFDNIGNDIIEKLPRPKKRIAELMLKSVKEQENLEQAKVFSPVFFRSPVNILGENCVNQLELAVNVLKGEDISSQASSMTEEKELIDCELVISSIGYKSHSVDLSLPFDDKKGIIQNTKGKVDVGLYTSGWLGTGPVGVILTTMSNAFGVAENIIEDIPKDNLFNTEKPGFSGLNAILKEKNIQIVDWTGWEKIDKYEIAQGEKTGKPREKVVDIKVMLEIAFS
ncbi:hypothetical protein ABEB36_000958 [Hypothenemus hampei]|uniref:NADPH:adrenodoxin oxidoreductase, mitochondrial n=1 Tax=Hypothenemus hampei TaxID=57062 RepID=A0ABD1FCZ6_HYPHA